MAGRSVRLPVWTYRLPAPATRTPGEQGAPAHLGERSTEGGESLTERSEPDVACCQRPEHRPLHFRRDGVEPIQQATYPSALAVWTESDVTRQRRRDTGSAGAVDEHFDRCAVQNGGRFGVEILEPLAVELVLGA